MNWEGCDGYVYEHTDPYSHGTNVSTGVRVSSASKNSLPKNIPYTAEVTIQVSEEVESSPGENPSYLQNEICRIFE